MLNVVHLLSTAWLERHSYHPSAAYSRTEERQTGPFDQQILVIDNIAVATSINWEDVNTVIAAVLTCIVHT